MYQLVKDFSICIMMTLIHGNIMNEADVTMHYNPTRVDQIRLSIGPFLYQPIKNPGRCVCVCV